MPRSCTDAVRVGLLGNVLTSMSQRFSRLYFFFLLDFVVLNPCVKWKCHLPKPDFHSLSLVGAGTVMLWYTCVVKEGEKMYSWKIVMIPFILANSWLLWFLIHIFFGSISLEHNFRLIKPHDILSFLWRPVFIVCNK